MRNKFLTIKSSLTFFIALLDNRLGLICPSLSLLIFLMIELKVFRSSFKT